MKSYIIICILFLGIFFTSCDENEVGVYQEIPRLNLDAHNNSWVEFDDKDYLNNVTEKPGAIEVVLMGVALQEPRTVRIIEVEDSKVEFVGEIEFEGQYIFPTDTARMVVDMVVKRPEVIGKECFVTFAFDQENPAHQFAPGLLENKNCKVSVIFVLKPTWTDYFGAYSNGKYMFMIKCFNKVLADIELSTDNRAFVREAYAEYRKTNPPIMDDETPAVEIVFP